MGLRSLLLLAAIVGVIWVLSRWRGQRNDLPRPPAREGRMVRCARCGLHLPVDEALTDGTGRPFCCAEHRRLGPNNAAGD